ncbi:hypothetical protein ACIPPM_10175 [Streptomyces sp. NPDC090119]|uniref:hypothetical protein n=1 Tax=Streptomyces sp. NPDC090119 TaxID=3365951 RepID=UPI003808BAD3
MNVAVIFFATALVVIAASLAAAGAGKLARLDGATYPTALTRAAAAFAVVINLATTIAATFAALFP